MDPASHNRQQGQFQRKGKQHLQDDIPRGVHDILADDGVRKLAGKDEGRYHQITDQQALEPIHSRNIIKLQITDNHTQFGIHSKSKSF